MGGTVFLGVTSVTGVTTYGGVACAVTPCKYEGVTGVTTSNSVVLS